MPCDKGPYAVTKVDVQTYISGLLSVPTGVKTLADLIQFNIDHASEELVQPYWTSQSLYVLVCH